MYKNTCFTPRTAITGCNYYVTGITVDTTTDTYAYESGCFDCNITGNYYPSVMTTVADNLTYTFINALD